MQRYESHGINITLLQRPGIQGLPDEYEICIVRTSQAIPTPAKVYLVLSQTMLENNIKLKNEGENAY